MYQYFTSSPDETFAFGKGLGSLLKGGDFLALSGDLAAGKTVFAQGIAAGLGILEDVTSPTYTIVQVYEGDIPLYHFDLYRLEQEEELLDIGFEEFIGMGGVCLVEWPDKFPSAMPEECLQVEIRPGSEALSRQIVLHPQGTRYNTLCREWDRIAGSGYRNNNAGI